MTAPGCYNKPRPASDAGYYVKVREYLPGRSGAYMFANERIDNTMTKECHQRGIPECAGCRHEVRIQPRLNGE